jgi:endoglucanase
MPLILGRFSAPQAIHSCFAHWLVGERRFLETAVRSSHFGLGANPMNLTLTTGLGHECPLHPLHLDSRNTGQPAPAGITVYGNNDFLTDRDGTGWLGWPFRWYFNAQCFPRGDDWPITESYFDVFGVPSMNEFTIAQTMAPASFVWGYLAARP